MTMLGEAPGVHFEASDFAPRPAEARGLARDEVRLLVGTRDGIAHGRFRDLPLHLRAGDVLVVNNSATVPGRSTLRCTVRQWCCTSRLVSTTATGWWSCAQRRTRLARFSMPGPETWSRSATCA